VYASLLTVKSGAFFGFDGPMALFALFAVKYSVFFLQQDCVLCDVFYAVEIPEVGWPVSS
jgi:hypothetical protein